MDGRTLASLALVLLPATAGAEVLNSGLRSEALWTDNVFGTAEDVVSDTSGRLSPWADVADNEGRLTWGLRYAPSYEYYIDQQDLTGFDQDASGRLAWQVGDRTTLRLSDRFQRNHAVARFNEEAAPGGDIIPVGTRQLFDYNVVDASLDHQLGPRDLLSFSVYQTLYDPSDEDQLDQSSLGSSLSFDHQLSERTSIGSSLSWSQQTVDRIEVEDSTTNYFNLSGVLSHAFSRTLNLALSAGPALIQSDTPSIDTGDQFKVRPFPVTGSGDRFFLFSVDDCPKDGDDFYIGPGCKTTGPPFTQDDIDAFDPIGIADLEGTVPQVDNSTTTYFANLSLTKEWEYSTAELSYTRSQGQTTSYGSISDVLAGHLNWRITRQWSADLAASYERRELANENVFVATIVAPQEIAPGFTVASTQAVRAIAANSGSGVDVMSLGLRVAYALTPRSSLYASANWRDESQTGDVLLVDNATRLGLAIGFSHTFAPISF